MKVACVQIKANDWKNADTAWASLKQWMREAAADNDLIIVPEAAYPAYFLAANESAPISPITEILAEVAELARDTQTYVAFGYADGKRNAASLFDPSGKEISQKAKSYLWHFDHRWFESGSEVAVAQTAFGRVALVVCADARLTELVRCAALEGAKLIIDLANLTASGPYADSLTNAQCEYMLATRARENGVWLAVADKWGVEADTVTYAGKSAVYGPDGSRVAQAPSNETTVVSVEIPVDSFGHIRVPDATTMPLRRPELYELLGTETQELPVYQILSESITPEFTTPYVTVSALHQEAHPEQAHMQHVQRLVEHEPHLITLPTFPGEIASVEPYQQLLEREQFLLLTDTVQNVTRSRLLTKEKFVTTYYTTHSYPNQPIAHRADQVFPQVSRCPFGYIGVMHQTDGLVPEVARCLMLAGADLVVWQHGLPHAEALAIARTRASENRIYVASVFSSALADGNVEGTSCLIDPFGAVMASTLLGRPLHATGAYCAFALARSKSIVPGTHVLFDRKPKNYRRLTNHEYAPL